MLLAAYLTWVSFKGAKWLGEWNYVQLSICCFGAVCLSDVCAQEIECMCVSL